MKCRLLYIIGELHTGGSERQLCYLLRELDRERYKPAVVVWNFRENDVHVSTVRSLGVPIYSLGTSESRIGRLRLLRTLVQQLEPQVVHSWSFYTNFAAYLAAKGTSAISVGSIRSDYFWAVKEAGFFVGKLSARWPRNQVANSALAAKGGNGMKTYFSPAHVSIVPNGVDLNQFELSPMPNTRPVRFIGIGYLLPIKRWDLLLLAIKQLKNQNLEFIAAIAGDGPLRSNLEKLAEQLGIIDRVQFLGHVEDIANELSKAAFVVHTGDAEGCPNSVMEAMASGRTVVATDVGDIPSLIKNGKTGFIVPRGDIPALKKYIEILASDYKLCEDMGKAARKTAECVFGLNHLAQGTLAVYRTLGWNDGGVGC